MFLTSPLQNSSQLIAVGPKAPRISEPGIEDFDGASEDRMVASPLGSGQLMDLDESINGDRSFNAREDRTRVSHGGASEDDEDMIDEAGSNAVTDYKRGKRFKKLTKMLASSQVCGLAAGR